MKLFARTKAAPIAERRSGLRTRVNCLATLVMPSGNRQGRLFDISATGARVVTQVPPPKGVSVIRDWNMYEAYCHVIWTRPGMCGVEFDRPLPARVLEELIETASAGPRPVHPEAGTPSDASGPPPPPTRFVG